MKIKKGDIFFSKKGEECITLEYKNHTNVKVKFTISGYEGIYKAHDLRNSKFIDRSYIKTKSLVVGYIFESKTSGKVEIIEISNEGYTIKFLDTGNIKTYKSCTSLLSRELLDTEKLNSIVGNVYSSNSYGDFKVIEYNGYHNIKIQFIETNSIVTVNSKQNMLKGEVKDPFYNIEVGKIYNSTSCGEYEVISHNGDRDITIKFINTGTIKYNVHGKEVRNGNIYDPNSGVQCRGYRNESPGYLYIHKFSDEWYKVGITNSYESRFESLSERNILKPESYKCFYNIDGKYVRDIETELLRLSTKIVDINKNSLSKYIKDGINEFITYDSVDKILTYIENTNMEEIKVFEGKIIQ